MPSESGPRPYRLAVDIGGTFTDVALQDLRTGSIAIGKYLTDAADTAGGVIAGVRGFLQEQGAALVEVGQVVHATTLATNTVLQRSGSRTGLITTRGFRDVLEIQRQKRYELYDFSAPKPVPLVDRQHIGGVDERINAEGAVIRRPDPDDVRRVAADLVSRGAKTMAVCLLHAYRNPTHEQFIRRVLEDAFPGLPVSISSEIAPMIREYERTSTTVVNAYVMPVMSEYLEGLIRALRVGGYGGDLFVMQSNGGIAVADTMISQPVRLIESGPAAGVLGAAFVGKQIGRQNLISFDMGGTTAKTCLVEDGMPSTSNEFEIDRVFLKSGSGMPLLIPAIDMIEIGAGGGSIAQVQLGVVTVGPQSAGASPGPICYGRSGTEPTVTDANLLLGYLDERYFLGGRMALDRSAAVDGVRERLARPLGASVEEAAWSVHQVVTTNMARAARIVSVERGRDPRLFALVAFGGAGPVHAARLARTIGIREVICPARAGVGSAVGLLLSDVKFDLARTRPAPLDERVVRPMREVFDELEQRAMQMIRETRMAGSPCLVRSADMRYAGQGHEISVTLPDLEFGPADVPALHRAFADAYERLYGYNNVGEPVDVVTWKLTASIPSSVMRTPEDVANEPRPAIKGRRLAYFPEAGGFTETAIYDRYALSTGISVEGPSIIEERESAIVLPPGDRALVDVHGNVRIEVQPNSEAAYG